MTSPTPRGIPRPLVRTNQWFIVLFVAAAWGFHSPWLLALPLVAGLLGLVVQFNPVIAFTRPFLRKPMTAYVMEEAAQQQFNQTIAVVCLGVSMLFWLLQMPLYSAIFSALVFISAFVAILGFCIACYIRFQLHQFKHSRANLHRS